MTWTTDIHIGELRPWPESVDVVRGAEERRYVAESENAKLRELIADLLRCVEETSICDNFYYKADRDGCGIDCYVNGDSCSLEKMKKRARTLGIEVDG